jgi:signal transduction histidine kinase
MGKLNLNQLLNDLALLIRHKLRNQQIDFVRRLAPELPEVMADGTQLAQAFLNLTLNAVEAMPQGGTLTITTRAVTLPRRGRRPSHVLIEFRDTGQGMPEAQRRRRFSTLLTTNKKNGTGLGLAIVGRVVETHHGKVRILSRPGKGTGITITLPV